MRLLMDRPQALAEPWRRFFARDGGIGLLYGNAPLTRLALYGITLAAMTPREVWVLDGANSFDAYLVARWARQWQPAPEALLARIHLARAFTCYQMSELIIRKLGAALQPFSPATIVGLGFLETFYDEDVPLTDAVRLLQSVLARLTELVQQGHTVLLTARELPSHARPSERSGLMNLLKAAATHTWRVDVITPPPSPVPTQWPLIVA